MDGLLDMLSTMRLSGGIFLDAEFTAPWCIAAKVGPEDCKPFTPEPRHIIAYHYVTAGSLLLKVGDQAPVTVETGELVVLPRNDGHVMGSALNLRPVNADHLIQPGPDGALPRIVYGGGGACTRLLCGFLGSDRPPDMLLAMLPSVMRLNVSDGLAGGWIESSFRFAAQELAHDEPRSRMMLAKMAELLFLEAVRCHFASQPPGVNAWTLAVRDPVVGRALALLHDQLSRRWTTEDLARELACSRSAFAERFTRAVGEPPMRYLARLRFERATAQLRESSNSIARIAYAVGYESEAAFTRAFRRAFGTPPAAWRREHMSAGDQSKPEH